MMTCIQRFAGLVALVMAGISLAWAQPDTAAIYELNRDRVLQIRVIDTQAESKAAIGSGFAIGQPGWLITNYHVIADLINNPDNHRAEWIGENEASGSLTLLAVDAVHDLALLTAEGLSVAPLSVAPDEPPKGTRIFAMGNPYDLGLTIVEGNYNGLLEKSLYEKIHFTGSINPGMSGGPALNQDGQVVGVNVATAGNQVSFLVPASYVRALLESTELADSAGFHERVATQLLSNQEAYFQTLLNNPLTTTRLNGYTVPGALADYLNCWGHSSDNNEEPITLTQFSCSTADDIFLAGNHQTGVVNFQHRLLKTAELPGWQFYRQLENGMRYRGLSLSGGEREVTDYDCQTGFIDQGGVDLKVIYCLRAFKKLSGLYDVSLEVISLAREDEVLHTSLVLGGASRENAGEFVSRFLSSFSWQPE